MVDFQEMLKQTASNLASQRGGFEEVVRPYSKLKYKELYIPKNEPNQPGQVVVRILPSTDPNDPLGFYKMYREIQIMVRNKANTKDVQGRITLTAEPNPDSDIEQNINMWMANNRILNSYGKPAKPSKKAKINVIQMFLNPDKTLRMNTDERGLPIVQVMSLSITALSAIMNNLQDPMFNPNPSDPLSFISSNTALPVSIVKPAAGSMSYTTNVYPNFPLAPLPQGWEQLAEDLTYQTTPSEEYDGQFLQFITEAINGTGSAPQQQVQQQPTWDNQGYMGNTPPQQMNVPQQQQVQQTYNQGTPQQTQQPVTPPQQTFTQPNQGFGGGAPTQQAPQQNFGGAQAQQGFGQALPSQGAPQQQFQATNVPVQNVPQQNTAPVQNVVNNEPQMNMPSNFENLPDAGQQFTPEPPVNETPPPVTNQGMPDISSLLDKMKTQP